MFPRPRRQGRATHVTGAIVGVGMQHRASAVRWGTSGNIAWTWSFTVPAAAFVTAWACWVGLRVF